jgi:hypothetical protein
LYRPVQLDASSLSIAGYSANWKVARDANFNVAWQALVGARWITRWRQKSCANAGVKFLPKTSEKPGRELNKQFTR